MKSIIKQRIELATAVVESLHEATEEIAAIASLIINCFSEGGTLLVAGNGGSATQAMHLCEELTGRYRDTRPALPALCLCSDAAAMTCIANDFGWGAVFKRQIEAYAKFIQNEDDTVSCNDVLLVLTTSGKSGNINEALQTANEMGLATIGLLGKDGGDSLGLCDLSIVIDGLDSAAIQDGHQVVLHAICEVIDAWVTEEIVQDTTV